MFLLPQFTHAFAISWNTLSFTTKIRIIYPILVFARNPFSHLIISERLTNSCVTVCPVSIQTICSP